MSKLLWIGTKKIQIHNCIVLYSFYQQKLYGLLWYCSVVYSLFFVSFGGDMPHNMSKPTKLYLLTVSTRIWLYFCTLVIAHDTIYSFVSCKTLFLVNFCTVLSLVPHEMSNIFLFNLVQQTSLNNCIPIKSNFVD